jgi:hypothetical protein
MGKISEYPIDGQVNGADVLIGSDATDSNITKNYTISSIAAFVLQGLSLGVTPVLNSVSNVNQVPSGLNSPLQVTFGPAQGSPSSPVQLLSNGDIVFNQSGLYLFNGYANFERQGSSGGVAIVAFRALINGVQVTPTKAVEINFVGVSTPYELTIPIQVNEGDVLKWEIMRDSLGTNAGGLYARTLLGGWGNVPSADVNIFKVGL